MQASVGRPSVPLSSIKSIQPVSCNARFRGGVASSLLPQVAGSNPALVSIFVRFIYLFKPTQICKRVRIRGENYERKKPLVGAFFPEIIGHLHDYAQMKGVFCKKLATSAPDRRAQPVRFPVNTYKLQF